MKKIIVVLLMIIVLFSVACNNTTDRQQATQTENLMQEADAKVGMPRIKNFREKQMAKDIMELRDQADYQTYTYVVSLTGEYIFLCDSIGYGLPYAVQYTNPEKRIYSIYSNEATIPQAEANGLFMPDALSATWVQCINSETGIVEPQYVEPQIMVFTYKLTQGQIICD